MVAGVPAYAQPVVEDGDLYYRRTHGGAKPPVGGEAVSHSWESADVIPACPDVLSRVTVGAGGTSPTLLRDNGVDPANLGKGDWIWQLPTCTNQLGGYVSSVTNLQSLIDWEKARDMQWITVKCGDGGSIWTQFTADLVNRAHAAGLKIFGWAYAYGNNVAGEIAVANNALSLGADGFIIDAESEYETLTNNDQAAAQYCQGIRAVYPNRFLAHAPFPIVSLHSRYPYRTFGTNCDAVMPQAYWADIGGTNYSVTMVTRMNTEWRSWQSSLTGIFTNAIKPIAPIAQGYNSVNGTVDGVQITNFVNALKTNAPTASLGGYQGASFWSCQHHGASPNKWPAIGGVGLGNNGIAPSLNLQPLSRVVDEGGTTSLSVSAAGTAPLVCLWRFNGTNIPNATNTTLVLSPARLTNTGNYSITITNAYGSVTSRVASLTVYPAQTVAYVDNFDTNSSDRWTVKRSSSDTRVTFSYDYASMGILPAPNSAGGTSVGVKFEANLTNGLTAAVSMSPNAQSFPADHRLRFDLWINANGPFPGGGAGSTEFFTAGIGTDGSHLHSSESPADGCWFAMDGDGGIADTSTTSADFGAFVGNVLQGIATGAYAAGTDSNARGNGNSYYTSAFPGGQTAPTAQQAAYPQQTGRLNSGTLGFGWHDVIVSRRGRTVEWAIDGVNLATLTNMSFTASNIFVGYWDAFPSISDNPALSFGLLDNLRVEVPAVAPFITLAPQSKFTVAGSNVDLTVSASGTAPLIYQWCRNGSDLADGTNATLRLDHITMAQAGNYAVEVRNMAGSVISAPATITVYASAVPVLTTPTYSNTQDFMVKLDGVPGYSYSIQASTNLTDWIDVSVGLSQFTYADTNAMSRTSRFYRAVLR